MKSSEQVRVLCVRTGTSLSELSRLLNQSPQNFIAKLKRDTLSKTEMQQIAEVLHVSYKQYFLLPDGERIE